MTFPTPKASIVIPAYNETEIATGLYRLINSIKSECEILVVVDSDIDTTIKPVSDISLEYPWVKIQINTLGQGPSNAIKFGINAAQNPIVVITMADGCDDPKQIDNLIELVQRGVVIAAGSRYMPGGQQVGGPRIKRFLSRFAGFLLYWLAGVGTRDATNSFKAYDKQFLNMVEIQSDRGFEIALELVAKAKRLHLPVAEIPTIWLDRTIGASNFKLLNWLPSYLRWFFYAFGPKIKKRKEGQ